ncbi:hypothetical protein LSM04_004083 [Trypanosoma melophagium]|uniref:uncharacterized protein n=1 Tax=Trypanosoma melophagium TaxID=715481 RepID=UPI00351A3CA2|nr:hypothetical protein LSM04_004083 [Trypanosoma melophagium]
MRRVCPPRTITSSTSIPNAYSHYYHHSYSCYCYRYCGFSGGTVALHPTPPRLRPQTIKPNPAHTPSGKFDRSFEKLSGELESRMPFRQQYVLFGNKYDRNFGEESYEELRQAAQDDIHGREPERAAARQARSYFTGDDLSPTALHVQSPRLKVAQQPQRQKYDKTILKTSAEAPEYYYVRAQPTQRRRERVVKWVVAAAAVWTMGRGMHRLYLYMLE